MYGVQLDVSDKTVGSNINMYGVQLDVTVIRRSCSCMFVMNKPHITRV